MSQDNIIEVQDLVKVYQGEVKALSGINFTVGRSEFFGFLGPNGAGKSTTIKILSTLLKKTTGKVGVAGFDVDHQPKEIRKAIGFAMQEVGLDDLSSGMDFLVMQGLLYNLGRKEARVRADELLELVGLTDVAKRKVGTYSGGMRRRIDLAGALVHRPEILFLDEPTTGLDPQSRLATWDHLNELHSQGTTILLTTQMMEEADHLCQRLAIIDNGLIVAEGTPESLKDEMGDDVVRISVASISESGSQELYDKALSLVGTQSYVTGSSLEGGELVVNVRDGDASAPRLLKLMIEHDIEIARLAVSRPTLDDVFLQHTGRTIRPDNGEGDEYGQAIRPLLGLRRRG
ncbi:MAG: ATP-binding cassette domain-containing protein [Chloroflexi bacterium]|nr:ATP-binding cassette domain-containing protein [Chloroflexota bacterium]